MMTEVEDDLSLKLGWRGSGVFRTEGDLGRLVAEFFGMKYLQDGGRTFGGFRVAKTVKWIE